LTISGSYAARLMSAAQNMAHCSPVSRRFAKLALNIWSIYGRVHVIHSILVHGVTSREQGRRHAPDNAWLVRKTIPCLIVLGGNKPSEVARAHRHRPPGQAAPLRGAVHPTAPQSAGPTRPQRDRRRYAQSRRSQQSHLGFEVQRNDAPTTACLVRINSNSIRLR
jgi:hypothetical protein